jgi:hypothetical protein
VKACVVEIYSSIDISDKRSLILCTQVAVHERGKVS